MARPQMIAFIALGLVALFAAVTIHDRLHAGCQYHGGRRASRGWICPSSTPVVPTATHAW